jgi:hypothetical protein
MSRINRNKIAVITEDIVDFVDRENEAVKNNISSNDQSL